MRLSTLPSRCFALPITQNLLLMGRTNKGLLIASYLNELLYRKSLGTTSVVTSAHKLPFNKVNATHGLLDHLASRTLLFCDLNIIHRQEVTQDLHEILILLFG